MQKFTPGPWRYAIARWTKEMPAAGFTIYADSVRKAPDGSEVGLAAGGTTGGSWAFSAFFSPEEIDANARLISAAPEMYALMQEARKYVECCDVPELLARYDAALAKATGTGTED